jgi:hypothetical protein
MKKYTDVEGVREIFENVRTINKENNDPLLFAMQLIIGYLNETEEDFQKTVDFVKEYNDCMAEILTCSAFLLHETLRKRWVAEGEYLEVHNTVNFTTNYNTPQQRLDRLNKIEEVFKNLNLKYNIYNRGLYYELNNVNAETGWEQSIGIIFNEHNKK